MVDIFIGGNTGPAPQQSLMACENALDQMSTTIIVNPPNNFPVDTRMLYDPNTNRCRIPDTANAGSAQLLAVASTSSEGVTALNTGAVLSASRMRNRHV